MNEEKTPFIAEIINGLLACTAVWFYRQDYFGFLFIFFLLWLLIFRKGLLAIAGAISVSLAVELYSSGATTEYKVVLALIAAGILLDLILLVGLPLLQRRPLAVPSIAESAFFAVIGVAIAYSIQIATCRVPVAPGGSFDMIQIFSRTISCHMDYINTQIAGYSTVNEPGFWNTVTSLCLRFAFMTPLFWACFTVALRRVNFNLFNVGGMLGYMVRAFLGISILGSLTLMAFSVFSISAPAIFRGIDMTAPSVIATIYFSYLAVDILVSAFAAAISTR